MHAHIGVDRYTKVVLTIIAVMLGVIAVRPVITPADAVRAQDEAVPVYIEPGIISIRNPDGSTLGDGKMVINLKTGDIWGFPHMLMGAPYPMDPMSSKPAVSKPVHIGHYDFSAMR